MSLHYHPYHIVTPSPWPAFGSLSALVTAMSAVAFFHGYLFGDLMLIIGIIMLGITMAVWWRDVIREATFQGHHTLEVQTGLKQGFILFIVSEALLFFSLFWAFFHNSLSPSVELGAVWPPVGIEVLNPWQVPLLNTIILLSSGIICQKWIFQDLFIKLPNLYALFEKEISLLEEMPKTLPFNTFKIPSLKRIGPHNKDIMDIVIGSLLGDGTMERDGNGSRFAFYQEDKNKEYIFWLHSRISDLGYCKLDKPKLLIRKSSGINSIRISYRFRTFTYSSWNWIYSAFYITSPGRKVIPEFIGDYLTPLSLAIWIMDDGCYIKNRGIKFSSNCFTLKEVNLLKAVLRNKFNLEVSIHKTGVVNQYNIYILKSSLSRLRDLTIPYIVPTMRYKLGL